MSIGNMRDNVLWFQSGGLSMSSAQFVVFFEDIDYEKWTRECGLKDCALEPQLDGTFVLTVWGHPHSIQQFARDLGWAHQKQGQ